MAPLKYSRNNAARAFGIDRKILEPVGETLTKRGYNGSNSLLKKSLQAFFNLAKFTAKLLTARKTAISSQFWWHIHVPLAARPRFSTGC